MKFKIKKGRHYSSFSLNRLLMFVRSKVSGTARFSYDCLKPVPIVGWNKLTGMSSWKIHKNSGRLVWRAKDGMILISAYVYKDGIRNEMLITSVLPDRYYKYSVEYINGFYKFTFNGTTVLMVAGKLGKIKFKCFPYFGGKSTAPEDLVIHI